MKPKERIDKVNNAKSSKPIPGYLGKDAAELMDMAVEMRTYPVRRAYFGIVKEYMLKNIPLEMIMHSDVTFLKK